MKKSLTLFGILILLLPVTIAQEVITVGMNRITVGSSEGQSQGMALAVFNPFVIGEFGLLSPPTYHEGKATGCTNNDLQGSLNFGRCYRTSSGLLRMELRNDRSDAYVLANLQDCGDKQRESGPVTIKPNPETGSLTCYNNVEGCRFIYTYWSPCNLLGSSCTTHAYKKCVNGRDLYWYDSCDKEEGLSESCNNGCRQGAGSCMSQPTCDDGVKRNFGCSGTDISYEQCNGGDWVTRTESCDDGCSNGRCLDSSCTQGQKKNFRCIGDNVGFEQCNNGVWGTQTQTCENGCFNGQCKTGCNGGFIGTRSCNSNGDVVQVYEFTNCQQESRIVQTCGGSGCSEGQCKSGSTECTIGQKRDYSCADGKAVDWCLCESNGRWNCVDSPQKRCDSRDEPNYFMYGFIGLIVIGVLYFIFKKNKNVSE